jgi:putative tricarboxylic transport membrane protein
MSAVSNSNSEGPRWPVQLGIGFFLLALAALLLINSMGLTAPAIAGVGPAAAQRLVAGLLAVLALAHGWQAWRGYALARQLPPAQRVKLSEPLAQKMNLAWVLAGLGALMASIALGGGFVVGATALFVATARGFGQAVGGKSLCIGLALTLAVFVFFHRVLSLHLPSGPLERLLF